MSVESQAELFSLFDELTDGICISGPGGVLLYMNPAAIGLLGLTADQLRDRPICGLLCGHMAGPDGHDCERSCPLKAIGSEAAACTRNGAYEAPRPTHYEWKDFSFKRYEKNHNFRVRCLRIKAPWLEPKDAEKHLTIIEDVSPPAVAPTNR